MNPKRHIQYDRSTTALVLSNLITIIIAVWQKWDLTEIMLVYWAQSVVIGLFNFKRILDLKKFSTKNFKINKRSVQPTRSTQRTTAWFFLLHYGMFHFVYFLFLFSQVNNFSDITLIGIAACILVFIFNHGYSYRYNREMDAERVPNIGTIMMFPYARIIPMHLTIIFGGALSGGSSLMLVFFLGLKTIADVIMHLIEHSQRKSEQ